VLVVSDTRFIVTLSDDDWHEPLLIVHRNTFDPMPRFVTPLAGLEGVVKFPAPLTTLHNPDPTIGVFPARVVVVALTI
jgi:hypothetical protein